MVFGSTGSLCHPEPMDSIVTAAGGHRRYGEGDAAVDALAGVSVGFERGNFSAIMGPSGSGKSTLMHILAGLDRPTAGTVTLDGEEITGLDDAELTRLRRDKLGFVFQFFNLIPVLTAEENVLLPLSIAGRKPDDEWFRRLIDTVDLGDRLTHRPAELSGGQQQRVAVARGGGAAGGGWGPWRGRSCRPPPLCSPTSPPATSTPARARRCSACCARPW